MESTLLLLKLRLLLHALDREPSSELHAVIIQEAEQAYAQAARTWYPKLILPCLFEERVAKALDYEQKRKIAYWRPLAAPGQSPGQDQSKASRREEFAGGERKGTPDRR